MSDLKPGTSAYPFVAGIYIDGGTGSSWAENITIASNTVTNFGIGISVGSENNHCDKDDAETSKDLCPVLTQFIEIENNIIRGNQLYGIGIGKDVFDDKDRQNSRTWSVRITGNSITGNVVSPNHKGYGQIQFGSLDKESLKNIELRSNVITTSNNGSLLIAVTGSDEKKYLIPSVSFYENQFFAGDGNAYVWIWGDSDKVLQRYKKSDLVTLGSQELKLPKGIEGANNIWKPL